MPYVFSFSRSLAGVFLVFLSFASWGQNTNVLRVMSANLTSGNFQKYETPGLDILKGLKPDVVAIQEFNYSNNAAADFRQMIDSTFGTNFSYFRETNSGYSIPNGIISRYPIIETGSWNDPVLGGPNRGFAWARIELPGTNELYVVSVHLYSGGTETDRNTEATTIKSQIEANFPAAAWVVVAGDFNTSTRTEAAIGTFKTFLSDEPIPTDAESGGDPDTNANRNAPYDYVLPSFSMTNALIPVVLPSHSFPKGLVFDSRVYTPLTDVPPVVIGDSGASMMQHMGVIKDFRISSDNVTNAPGITSQPQSQTVVQGSNATFTVTAFGTAPLSFQWSFNGAPLDGATASSYTRTNVQPGDAGDYFVVVTNVAGSATSSNATLTVSSSPMIVTDPQSQTVSAGQDATFTVLATGPSLNYQWRFYVSNIANATASSYTRTNVQSADAGNYSVVVSNSTSSVTSAVAVLTVLVQPLGVIAQWNFNNTNTSVSSPPPSIGSGTITLVGGATSAWGVTGTGSVDTNNPNNAWNTATYPAQGTGNKTAGVQFNVSTAGRQNISIRWDERMSNTGSKYVRLQYATNGTSFSDFPMATAVSAGTVFEPKTNSLAGFPGVDNNPNFAFRIVAEFESTAANTANANYVGAGGSYGTAGTIRFDMMTVSGTSINSSPSPATLSAPAYNGAFQFIVTGSANSNYMVQASTNLSGSNWISLLTNTSPFTFVETNVGVYPTRFYRAVALP
jgi:endonuclease/exonuclease/phosphatase family metal-dependent hydrolase